MVFLLEYLPYRKDDGPAAGDYPKHTYLAQRGYVSVRADIRAFGASQGVPPEREYSALQMAMRHAPELKAILAVDATAELFHDDVHYIDGMAHLDEFELNMDRTKGQPGDKVTSGGPAGEIPANLTE